MGLTEKLAAAAFGLFCFAIVYWWRRRTRAVRLNLSLSSEKLDDLVDKSDKPTVEEIEEVVERIVRHDRS